MLQEFFSSKARIKLLSLLLTNPEKKFYLRQIEKIIDQNITSIRREVLSFLNIGFISEKKVANLKYYQVNKDFMIYKELRSIFLKSTNPKKEGLKDYALKYLGKLVRVEIDRPLGSKHPKHKYHYPLNYGYIPNTKAPDGGGIDAYILGVYKPVKQFKGKCIAIIHRLDDDDDKLIIVPENENFKDEDIKALTQFQERFFKSKIIRKENVPRGTFSQLDLFNK